MTQTQQPASQKAVKTLYLPGLLLISMLLLAGLAGAWFWHQQTQKPQVTVWTSQGILQKIQSLNNVESVAYHVETIITSEKAGNWYALWQDEQRGLFIAQGTVRAGLHLGDLTAKNIQISPDGQHMTLTLPPATLLSAGLDNVRTYDIQTGLYGLAKLDPDLLNKAQAAARHKLVETACNGDILKMATANAVNNMQQLFALALTASPTLTLDVKPVPPTTCQLAGY